MTEELVGCMDEWNPWRVRNAVKLLQHLTRTEIIDTIHPIWDDVDLICTERFWEQAITTATPEIQDDLQCAISFFLTGPNAAFARKRFKFWRSYRLSDFPELAELPVEEVYRVSDKEDIIRGPITKASVAFRKLLECDGSVCPYVGFVPRHISLYRMPGLAYACKNPISPELYNALNDAFRSCDCAEMLAVFVCFYLSEPDEYFARFIDGAESLWDSLIEEANAIDKRVSSRIYKHLCSIDITTKTPCLLAKRCIIAHETADLPILQIIIKLGRMDLIANYLTIKCNNAVMDLLEPLDLSELASMEPTKVHRTSPLERDCKAVQRLLHLVPSLPDWVKVRLSPILPKMEWIELPPGPTPPVNPPPTWNVAHLLRPKRSPFI